MGIKLLQNDKFDYQVDIPTRDEKGNSLKFRVVFTFKKMSTDELRERQMKDGTQLWQDCLVESGGDIEEASKKFNAELHLAGKAHPTAADMADNLMSIVVDWKDVTDDDGPMSFCRDNLIRLLNCFPTAYTAIKEAFNEANSAEGKRKN